MNKTAETIQTIKAMHELYSNIQSLEYQNQWLNSAEYEEEAPDEDSFFSEIDNEKLNRTKEAEKKRIQLESEISKAQEEIAELEREKDAKIEIREKDEKARESVYAIIVTFLLCVFTAILGLMFRNWITYVLLGVNLILILLHYLNAFRLSRIVYLVLNKSGNNAARNQVMQEFNDAKGVIDCKIEELNSSLTAEKQKEKQKKEAIEEDYQKQRVLLEAEFQMKTVKYRASKAEFDKENKKKIEENDRQLAILKKQLESMQAVSPKYYDDLGEIAEILESGRAESVKEALNVLENDKANQRQIAAIEERNDEIRRHNREMEYKQEQANQQARLAREEAKEHAWRMEQQAHEESMRQRERDARERDERERHNREMERITVENQRQANQNAEMLVKCSNCPHAPYCWHKGRTTSECASYGHR